MTLVVVLPGQVLSCGCHGAVTGAQVRERRCSMAQLFTTTLQDGLRAG